jgi:hypothetical protein
MKVRTSLVYVNVSNIPVGRNIPPLFVQIDSVGYDQIDVTRHHNILFLPSWEQIIREYDKIYIIIVKKMALGLI